MDVFNRLICLKEFCVVWWLDPTWLDMIWIVLAWLGLTNSNNGSPICSKRTLQGWKWILRTRCPSFHRPCRKKNRSTKQHCRQICVFVAWHANTQVWHRHQFKKTWRDHHAFMARIQFKLCKIRIWKFWPTVFFQRPAPCFAKKGESASVPKGGFIVGKAVPQKFMWSLLWSTSTSFGNSDFWWLHSCIRNPWRLEEV